jgi:phosphocarrier protein FPr
MPSCFLLDESRQTIGVIHETGCDPPGSRKEARLVGLILVSHSGTLVDGLREMVVQVAGPDVAVGTAGGTDDGRLGTSAPRIADAVRDVLDRADSAVVLLDLGSAALSLELALEDLSEEDRRRVRVSEAPLVEGAVLAAVQASVGASLDEVVAAAESASTMAKLPRA